MTTKTIDYSMFVLGAALEMCIRDRVLPDLWVCFCDFTF